MPEFEAGPHAEGGGAAGLAAPCEAEEGFSGFWGIRIAREEAVILIPVGAVPSPETGVALPGTLAGLAQGEALDEGNGRLDARAKSTPPLLPPSAQGAGNAVAFDLAVAVVEDADILPLLESVPERVE